MKVTGRIFQGLVLASWLLLTSAFAESIDSDLKTDSALDAGFKIAAEQVSSALIQAPEASLIYLEHWIDVFNELAREAGEQTFDLAPSDQVRAAPNQAISPTTGWIPNGAPIVAPLWGQRATLSFDKSDKFRPNPPPDIKSLAFERDIEDVFRVGERYGENRTADQSISAAFWADGIGTVTPPGRWNLIALQETAHLPEMERAQILLALNIALYDSGIAAWDAKYSFNYWRPTTAITNLYPEHDDWEPMMPPPFHPEYVLSLIHI